MYMHISFLSSSFFILNPLIIKIFECILLIPQKQFLIDVLIIVYFFTAGRPPGPELDNCTDRESYSLAAGLALGLVMFGVRYATYTVGTDVDLVLGKHTIVQSTLLFFFAGSDQRSKGKKLTFPFFKQPNICAS